MDAPATLKFLGTAGARFAASTQSRHSGGLVYALPGATVWVDPGPGALVFTAPPPLRAPARARRAPPHGPRGA